VEPGRTIEYYRGRWVTGGSNPSGAPAAKPAGIEPSTPHRIMGAQMHIFSPFI
jgi:hypothetical protein